MAMSKMAMDTLPEKSGDEVSVWRRQASYGSRVAEWMERERDRDRGQKVIIAVTCTARRAAAVASYIELLLRLLQCSTPTGNAATYIEAHHHPEAEERGR